jgi:hypothetical protein
LHASTFLKIFSNSKKNYYFCGNIQKVKLTKKMDKKIKIAINFGVLVLIVGFVWYISSSTNANEQKTRILVQEDDFETDYVLATSFDLRNEINRFDLYDDKLFVSVAETVYILDIYGNQISNFSVDADVRDIAAKENEVYILYPTYINVYSTSGELQRYWAACSNESDYCSFTVTDDAVFVTDAANKEVHKYTTDGMIEQFIRSPIGFVIPSYSFDVAVFNDTLYVTNSGRHIIEKYTLDGKYISSFGKPGVEKGSFAGCCNPVYISFAPDGSLVTSEKGNPRISNFARSGTFNSVWLNDIMLGGSRAARQAIATDDKLFVAIDNKITVFNIQ